MDQSVDDRLPGMKKDLDPIHDLLSLSPKLTIIESVMQIPELANIVLEIVKQNSHLIG